MNDDPCNTALIVANMMYNYSLHGDGQGFDALLFLKMFACVEETRGFDENFMEQLYDHLRILSQDDPDFVEALEDAEIYLGD